MLENINLIRYVITTIAVICIFPLAGCTSLNLTLANRNIDGARSMIQQGQGDVNQVYSLIGWTPLMYAAKFGAIDLVRALLEKGARTDAIDVWGNRVSHFGSAAPSEASYEIVKLLLEKGAPADVINSRGYTLVHTAFSTENATVGKPANPKLVQLLLAHGAPFDHGTTSPKAWFSIRDGEEQQGHTPLMLAAKWRQSEIAGMLLAKGADPNKQTVEGWSAIHFAALNGADAVAAQLFEAGAVVLPVSDSATARLATARAYSMSGLRQIGQGNQEEATKSLASAIEYLSQAGPEFEREGQARSIALIAYNVFSFSSATYFARADAQAMAAGNPRGIGVGVRPYETVNPMQPISSAASAHELLNTELEALTRLHECVSRASQPEDARACRM